MNLDGVFEQLLEKPGIYIGYPSVTRAFAFLRGYASALDDLGIKDDSLVLREFQDYVWNRYGVNAPVNWAGIFLLYCFGNEVAAFELMAELWREFLATRQESDGSSIVS
ncbi:MAG: hypothetical protein IPN69_23335 [Acidobacteria bacterium]|nr:hypothetical protein [Acidobacteriota bacterium]MBK8813643.1 hypothetical protein [Acidobacteriota bacterium]